MIPFWKAHAHLAPLQIDLQHHRLDGGQQSFFPLGGNDQVDIVRAGFENFGEETHGLAVFIHHGNTEQLVMIILALGEIGQRIGAHVNDLIAQQAGGVRIFNALKGDEQGHMLAADVGDLQRAVFVADVDRLARAQPLGKISEDIHEDLTVDAVRAAQTGHLVFSTLHTNDSVSAVTRLMDMRIDPFLIGSSLVCSIAQRLARRVCRHCQEPEMAIPERLRREMARCLKLAPEAVQAQHGRGCVECNQQGCRGRIALYEFFLVTDEISDLIEPGVKTTQLREAARRNAWSSLRDQGWLKVQHGIIPVSEQQRLTNKVITIGAS